MCCLSDGSDRRSSWSSQVLSSVDIDILRDLAVGILLRTITRDVTGFTTLIASLASSVERTTVGSGTIPRDMTKLATSIAFHGLSLTIPGKVVRATALIASSRSRTTSKATTTAITTISSTAGDRSTTT